MSLYWLVIGVLSVWRLTHLFNAEDGPWHLLVRLRNKAGSGFFGALLDCFYCLSLWVAAPFSYMLGQHWMERFFLWLSLSAGAILIERVTAGRPAIYMEEKENHVLRKENDGDSRGIA